MKRVIFHKILTIILFAISIILSWGGIIYATINPDQFRIFGIFVSFVGYGTFFWAVFRYEKNSEQQS